MKDLRSITLPRPGGTELTSIATADFLQGDKLLDVGCGHGETVKYLRKRGFCAIGIDHDKDVIILQDIANSHCFRIADATDLPYSNDVFDGVLFECSLSKIATPNLALSEANRVLKPAGRLIVSDFFTQNQECQHDGILGRMEKLYSILNRIRETGFYVTKIEDYSRYLRPLWGQLIFDIGRETLIKKLSLEEDLLGTYGYFLLTARKADRL